VSGLLWLQAQQQPPGISSMLLPFAMIAFIFYFLVFRPQQKKQQETTAMLSAIEKGDTVVTAGGLHGKVTGVSDDVLTIEIASIRGDNVRVKVTRNRIEHVDSAKAKDSAKKEAKKDNGKEGGGS